MPDPFAEHVAQPTPAPNPSTQEAAPLDPLDTIGIPGELDTPPPTPRPRPTMGRIVLYRMMESDIARMPWGAGNVEPGDTAPAIVVKDYAELLSLHAFPDCQTSAWVHAASEGTEPGQWSWPPRDGTA